MTPDTIAAIATPYGSGGIGIIKISGPAAGPIAEALFKPFGPRTASENDIAAPRNPAADGFQSHRLHHGRIVDPHRGEVLDEVLLVMMRAPHSYTREDVVEIQAHSGRVGLKAILDQVLRQGARLAEPGEFTKRAFLNGRIDLTQAEAVIDLIHAKTQAALNLAVNQTAGGLSRVIQGQRRVIVDVLAELEADIDFPDELHESGGHRDPQHLERLTAVREQVAELIHAYPASTVLREGIKMAIAGRTNVGKSSLLNCLLEKQRAIVTDIPGTTRDLIEDQVHIRGVPFIITDTAGLQETHDPIEKIGIDQSQAVIEAVDLVLIVLEADAGWSPTDEQILERCRQKAVIVVVNKNDLETRMDDAQLTASATQRELPMCRISAKYHTGIDTLRKMILAEAEGVHRLQTPPPHAVNLRQKHALEECHNALRQAIAATENGAPAELITIDLKEARDRLGEVTGEGCPEEVLDRIFQRFCIGK